MPNKHYFLHTLVYVIWTAIFSLASYWILRDSNLNYRTKKRARRPLDHHHGPDCNGSMDMINIQNCEVELGTLQQARASERTCCFTGQLSVGQLLLWQSTWRVSA